MVLVCLAVNQIWQENLFSMFKLQKHRDATSFMQLSTIHNKTKEDNSIETDPQHQVKFWLTEYYIAKASPGKSLVELAIRYIANIAEHNKQLCEAHKAVMACSKDLHRSECPSNPSYPLTGGVTRAVNHVLCNAYSPELCRLLSIYHAYQHLTASAQEAK